VLLGAIALIALLAFGVAGKATNDSLDQAIARGHRPPAPKLDLPRLTGEGNNQTLADYKGKVVVVNFWASWCAPCRDESPLLERWQKRLAPRGATILGVDAQDIDSDARDFIGKYKLSYPMLRDKDGNAVHAYGATGFPETFVIDQRGNVAALQRGPVDDRFMREAVEPLLKTPGSAG
jgi:cytochrome c biogenesis protein CcmG/thiol:disulfide interchange protein DsbE